MTSFTRRLAVVGASAAALLGSVAVAPSAAASGVTVGKAAIQFVSCHEGSHRADFNLQVFADIDMRFIGTEQFALYAETRYRPYGSSTWNAWGSGKWKYFTIADYSVLTWTGPQNTPGQYQVRFHYYWQHFTASGQSYWTSFDAWDYPQRYRQYWGAWDNPGLDSTVCSL